MSISNHIMDLVLTNVAFVLRQHNIEDAQIIAQKIVEEIQKKFGGGELYIPLLNRDQRNADIKKEFTGQNHSEICSKYRISLSTLYRIISK